MDKLILSTEPIEKLIESIADAVSKKIGLPANNAKPKDDLELLTRDEACKFLKIDQSTLYHWTQKGKVKAYGIGNRRYYKRNELIDSLKPLNQ